VPDGTEFTVTAVGAEVEEHPLSFVSVTLYEPGELTTID
jgi:hypothetical protein